MKADFPLTPKKVILMKFGLIFVILFLLVIPFVFLKEGSFPWFLLGLLILIVGGMAVLSLLLSSVFHRFFGTYRRRAQLFLGFGITLVAFFGILLLFGIRFSESIAQLFVGVAFIYQSLVWFKRDKMKKKRLSKKSDVKES